MNKHTTNATCDVCANSNAIAGQQTVDAENTSATEMPKLYDREVSVVIPVYNEEGIITSSVEDLVHSLEEMQWSYEIILCENGSRDATLDLARNLSQRFPHVRYCSVGEPNYGKAMRLGILEARGQFVICDEIDLGDIRFYRNALAILRQDAVDMVIGSKLLAGAQDDRGWIRNSASKILNNMLRIMVGFQGSDTHGLKAFRRSRLLRVVEACIVDRDLFTSEMVIRAERNNIRIREIPLQVIEKRQPSINLFRRVPNVLKNMAKLVWIFRLKGE
jgi:glycosyltransferase involved in cell wall biosynthesis